MRDKRYLVHKGLVTSIATSQISKKYETNRILVQQQIIETKIKVFMLFLNMHYLNR